MEQKKYGLNELREMFLKFFESKGHLRLPSFPLVPQNDASLLLINSGMAPMKPYFTGEVEPPRSRVCTCQKCIRTGDIENIGKTSRHGTYFEMLGNFSFGDYFKKEAIAWCWEFLTSPDWVGLDPNRLYPSVYLEDDEAAAIWREDIGFPDEKIFRFGKADNFWEHGSGPCGPCSEVYYDRGEKYGCGEPGCTVGCECDRYIEVWNNVFSQFNSDGEGNYEELQHKNIDTGMGLERLAVVCQDVPSLFDVDTVMSITNKVSQITGAYYGKDQKTDVSLRVITDHIRSATFMICDGVLPSNEGRGYVLRRLLRRAARHGKLLGVNEPFLFSIIETVIAANECQYPDLREKQDYITRVIKVEEENFAKTIDGGMRIFADLLAAHKAKHEMLFSGEDAFKLYDTYGFPVDLTSEMLEEEGMQVNIEAFKNLMEEQRQRARKAREALGDLGWAGLEFGADMPSTEFVGYEYASAEGKVLAIVAGEEFQDSVVAGVEAILVLDKSVMYAEMGGQTADHGTITGKNGVFAVHDVQKNKGGKFMHYGVVTSGELKLGETVTTAYDEERRKSIMRAHSATHLLQVALKNVLGDHVHQAGSLVEPDHLRFDFTHFSAISPKELMQIEREVNDAILEGYPIFTEEMSIEDAKKAGAMALFNEKYGDTVRVVSMGEYSKELCGGTHLDNTAKVGPFRIKAEFSVASGVRRMEAITGRATLDSMNRNLGLVHHVAEILKTKPHELVMKLEQQISELRTAKQLIEQYKAKQAAGETENILMSAKSMGELRVLTINRPNLDANAMRQMGDILRDREPNIVAVLASVSEGDKITFLAVCGKNAVAKGVKAGDLVRSVCKIAGGSGGGKPDSAMGGGKDVLKVDDALASVDDFISEKISG